MSRTPSFWLDQVGPERRRPPLDGVRDADVCIVGGGFTGLWTAYELRRADPSLDVVVLEAQHVGFGASGRNGGWVLGKLSGSRAAWRRRGGPDGAKTMVSAIQQTVDEIGAVVEREAIACDWRQGGSLTVAQSDTQWERLRSEAASEHAELGDDLAWQLLDAQALASRIRVSDGCGALFTPHCARVQPAKLVAGLADAAERAGAVIYESTPVTDIAPGLAQAPTGQVRARYVLRATEGYTADLPGKHRVLLPMNSSMIVTEPLDEAQWAQIGWDGAETMLDGSHVYTYSQRTSDGRIAIGGRGVPYRFGSRTDREGPVPQRTIDELQGRLVALFPALRDVGVARAWHGVLGVARDWLPTVGLNRSTGLGYAGGYAGEGVAASNLAARTLRDMVLGRDSELTRLPWVGHPARNWEPEPLRFVGARGIYTLYRVADRHEQVSGRESPVAAMADRIAGR
ncbi:MAG TPA: FAD-binding oxidoreductase [Solirubrobacteraceae bacterium]|jgi:glycine/D-amino acid oxidase-like deaminating enzyme|nr:FAD-binding oxidoreductase [Solirubrobacteraceae bacterium]